MNLEKIKSYIPLLTFISVISTIIGGVYFFGGFMAKVEEGQLTPTEKVKTLNHINNSPNDVDMFLATKKLDSIAKLNINEAQENLKRDSIRDEQVSKNTITVYQIKEILNKMQREQSSILESLNN